MTFSPEQPRPSFVVFNDFVETAFEKRFQGLLQTAWRNRSWHVIAAVPGSGKSLGIHDFLLRSSSHKQGDPARTRLPVLAIRAPKNAGREQVLGMAFASAFGVVRQMPWSVRRSWLVQMMAQTDVGCIVIDDAQDLHVSHLAFLKELTDNLAAPPYERQIGLCLVAAHSGHVVPFQATFAGPEILWRQFRRRMDTEKPYCIVLGHTEAEVQPILATFENFYQKQFPDLQLQRWTKPIFTWLTNPVLDPDATGRVTMDHLTRLVSTTLRKAYEEGASDITSTMLTETAELMILRREETTLIDEMPKPSEEVG